MSKLSLTPAMAGLANLPLVLLGTLFLLVAVQAPQAGETSAKQPAGATDADLAMETGTTTASPGRAAAVTGKPQEHHWALSGEPDIDVDMLLRLSRQNRAE